jgi:uncharacterized protein YndB with AHSA1/START domain
MTTSVARRLAAPRSRVYAALVDPAQVAQWRFPSGMTCQVHQWHAVVGGELRVSLTYTDPARLGKSSAHTDTYRGRFVELVRDQRVVEVDEFETSDDALRGEMTITVELADAGESGTLVTARHAGLPPGVAVSANEQGWQEALERLARLVER